MRTAIHKFLQNNNLYPSAQKRFSPPSNRLDCALMANVHLPHHPNLTIRSLHDYVHLRKDVVGMFTLNLKDAALGRNPDSPQKKQQRIQPPQTTLLTTNEAQSTATRHHRYSPLGTNNTFIHPEKSKYNGPSPHLT